MTQVRERSGTARRRWARACAVWAVLGGGPLLAALAGCGRPGASADATAAPTEQTDLILAYSGDMDGNLQPCGCHRNTAGGLARRATALTKLRAEGPPVVAIEYGNQFTAADQITTSLDSLAEMQYDTVALGDRDREWARKVLDGSRERKLTVLDEYAAGAPATKVVSVERGGKRVAILAFAPPPPGAKAHSVAERAKALRDARAGHDVVVLISYLKPEEELKIRSAAPGTVDILIAGTRTWGSLQASLDSGVWLLPTSWNAESLGVARLHWAEGGLRVSATKEVLDRAWRDDDAVGSLVAVYNEQRGDRVQRVSEAALELGTAKCSGCHISAYHQWKATKHSFGVNSLSLSGHLVGDCLKCHSSTYRKLKVLTKNPYVQGIECLDCHPKAQEHLADALAHPDKAHPLSTQTMPLSPALCIKCHTQEQDPNFDFTEYWLRIRHRESR